MFINLNKCYQEKTFISLAEHCPQKLLSFILASHRICGAESQIASPQLVVFGEHSWAQFENICSSLGGSLETGR